MKKNVNISAAKILSVGVMCCCLLFLTCVNFIVYPSSHSFSSSLIHNSNSNDEEAPVPVEEKSSAKTGLTIQEEYIHELHTIKGLSDFVVLSKHKIPDGEKLQVVHFELDAPPPKA